MQPPCCSSSKVDPSVKTVPVENMILIDETVAGQNSVLAVALEEDREDTALLHFSMCDNGIGMTEG